MIETKNLRKTYKDGDKETEVLKGIDFKVDEGEFIAIMGRSGAGKSTFMYQMGLLDEPTEGEIILDGDNTRNLDAQEKTTYRLRKLGYVFQDYALIPDLTALENVSLPLLMHGLPRAKAELEAKVALELVDLGSRLDHLPSQLSGGEQQRVSIARAIAHRPKILFADEPTANLDHRSSNMIMDIFKQLHKAGQTIVMVTHEDEYGAIADRIVRLDDGKVV